MKLNYIAYAFLSALILLTGCKTLEQNQASARLVITYGVAKYIEAAGEPEAQAARAVRVRKVTEQAISIAAGGNVAIAALEGAVRAEVAKLTLSLADRALADGLIAMIAAELAKKLGDGVLSEEQLVQTKEVLGWIVDATAYAAPVA